MSSIRIGSIMALVSSTAQNPVRLKIMILSKSIWFYQPVLTYQRFAAKFSPYATIKN